MPTASFGKERAKRWAGLLLFVLAVVVALAAATTLSFRVQPEASCLGIGITVAALFVMLLLVWGKRRVAKATNNRAMAADAVQSKTCAYLVALTIAGLGINALFHIHWVNSAAALTAVPILIIEGRRATRVKAAAAIMHDRDRDEHVWRDYVHNSWAYSSCVAWPAPRCVENE
jgi:divalent metal cation (Fe/Co/Zn/Cd) transporter